MASKNGNESLPNADDKQPPKLISGRMGTRLFSMAALVERLAAAFEQEHGTDSAALSEAQSRADKLKLLRETLNYVIAVESITLSAEEQAELTRNAYADIFSYGPLDSLFADETITTISLESIDKIAVRYGHGDLVTLPPVFEDQEQLRKVIHRLLHDADAAIQPDHPYLETGLLIERRRVCLNLVLPPISPFINVDIRVHPTQLPALEALVDSPPARELLTAIAQSEHGFVVVGEAESGKTTLMSILLNLAHSSNVISVERAGELFLPEGAKQLVVQWAVNDEPGITFGEQIANALTASPDCIILDEVRADEPAAVVPLLTWEQPLRQMWTFRGPADSKRLASALGMLARRGDATHNEALVQALYRQLPFVIVMRRRKDRLQLHSISEWQFPEGAEYPDYVELMTQGWEGIEFTGKHPSHTLPLPDDFWG